MSGIVRWTGQHRLLAFFVLTYAVSWWAWPFYALGRSPTPFFACGPLVAALVVIGLTRGPRRVPGMGRATAALAGRLAVVGGGPGHAAGRAGAGRGRERRDLGSAGPDDGRAGVVGNGAHLRDPVRQPARRPARRGARLAGLRAGRAAGPALPARRGGAPRAVRRWLAPAAGGVGHARPGRAAGDVRYHHRLRVAVPPHRRQRPADHGLPRRAGDRQLRGAGPRRGRRGTHGLAHRRALGRPRAGGRAAGPGGLANRARPGEGPAADAVR
jgi:hypothetical protein